MYKFYPSFSNPWITCVPKQNGPKWKESWALKNWWVWTVVLEKTLESPLDCKEIRPVHSEGDQPWDFFGGNDAEAETPVLWPPDAKSWLIGKDSDAGRDWGQEVKGTTEDEMAGWHHWFDGHKSELVKDRELWHAVIHEVAKSQTRLSDWTELNWPFISINDTSNIQNVLLILSLTYSSIISDFRTINSWVISAVSLTVGCLPV